MSKTPTRSPTHEDLDPSRLATMAVDLEDIVEGDEIALPALVELAEDRGRPASHYLATIPLATDYKLAQGQAVPLTVKVCAGTCQRWGALDLLDHLAAHLVEKRGIALAPVSCLDHCDQAPAAEVHGAHGKLVLAPATSASIDEALSSLA
jgi:NADH:ubiquinone oxidoreductase subunit E